MEMDLIAWHMEKGTTESRDLYARFVEILDEIGPYTIHPAKSNITFKGTRRGFCGAHPQRSKLVGYLDLTRKLTAGGRIRSANAYTKRLFVHKFRIIHPSELDAEFKEWLVEAYSVGQGAHLSLPHP